MTSGAARRRRGRRRAVRLIALCGMRASGKSTLCRALAGRLGWPAVDGDEVLAAAVGEQAGEHLARVGERAFRAVEARETLRILAEPGPRVVALGGGAVLSAEVCRALEADDVLCVFLDPPVECLVERLRAPSTGPSRPPLTDLPLASEVETLLAARRPLYEKVADFRVETSGTNVDSCCDWIAAMMA